MKKVEDSSCRSSNEESESNLMEGRRESEQAEKVNRKRSGSVRGRTRRGSEDDEFPSTHHETVIRTLNIMSDTLRGEMSLKLSYPGDV